MIWLIFAHYIGDFALQKEWVSYNKGRMWYLMVAHCAIWTGCVCAFYAAFVRNDGAWTTVGVSVDAWKIAFLFLGHIICDRWKCRAVKDVSIGIFPTWHFYIDQCWHLLQCSIVYYF